MRQWRVPTQRRYYEAETIELAWNHTAVQDGIPDLFPALTGSEIPLLFVHGTEDNLVQNAENVRTLAEHLKHAEYRTIDKAGHVFFNRAVWSELEQMVFDHIDRQ